MLFIGSHATRTCSGDSQRGIFISPRYQLITGIIYRKKRQFKRAIPACQGQKPRARHGQRKLAATSYSSKLLEKMRRYLFQESFHSRQINVAFLFYSNADCSGSTTELSNLCPCTWIVKVPPHCSTLLRILSRPTPRSVKPRLLDR